MARVTVEDCLDQIVDHFALVHLATLRYRQLHRGANRLVESRNKDVVTALREIASGVVRFREDVFDTVVKAKGNLTSGRTHTMGGDDSVGEFDDMDNATPLI
ncbi:MAG: DNA-directed RNA polymerase subunit omega [Myxococcales bacterium]|nr:DNA-directed RNA polymerase subunit omega [Myxococcales bacterium]